MMYRIGDLALSCRRESSFHGKLIIPILMLVVSLSAAPNFADEEIARQEEPAVDWPTPRLLLADLASPEDEAAFQRTALDRAGELAKQCEAETALAAKAGFLLAAANLLLSDAVEPFCTRALMTDDHRARKNLSAALTPLLDRCDEYLKRVSLGRETPDEESDKAEESNNEVAGRLETLRAFSDAIRAFFLIEEEGETARERRRAASGLSALLEHEDADVAVAAALWQAILRSEESDLSVVLASLEPALGEPKSESMPYSFYARLLRCRLLARQGGFAVASSLLVQLEVRCEEWFPNEATRVQAMASTSMMQLRVLREWHDRLGADSKEEKEWCRNQAVSLTKRAFPNGDAVVLRLSPLVPVVAPAPVPREQPTGNGVNRD